MSLALVPKSEAPWSAAVFRVLDALFRKHAGALLLRALLDGKPPIREIVPLGGSQPVRAFVSAHITERNVYIGPSLRKPDATTGGSEGCLALPALWAEIDFKDTPEAEARERIAKFPLPPSIVNHSGGGLHVFWLLDELFPLAGTGHADAKVLLIALADALGGDRQSAEPARVLRLPGTLNYKYDPPRLVTTETLDATRLYTIDEIRATVAYGKAPTCTTRKAAAPLPDVISEGARDSTLTSLAGTLRHRGLGESEILATLRETNEQRVDPKLPDRDLARIARSIASKEPGERHFPLTDTGNAESFAADVAEKVRYDHARKAWNVFREHHWSADEDALVDRLLQDHIRVRFASAPQIAEDDRRRAVVKHLIRSESATSREACLKLTRSQAGIADSGHGWDADPWLFGVQNGVIDLRTGTLRRGVPADRITLVSPVTFDPAATCPRFDQFLSEIFAKDEAVITYVQRIAGYLLTGVTTEQIFWILFGGGANGKSTLLELLAYIFGPYAWGMPFPSATWSESMGEYQKASLFGKRLVSSAEVTKQGTINEELIKSLTGGDTINARHPYGRPFCFIPTAKFLLRVNNQPIVRDDSRGFWRRVRMLPFTQSFEKNPNPRLGEELRSEAPGVLAWAMRGCLDWQRDGLAEPDIVRAASEEYRQDQDPLTGFLNECCTLAPAATAGAADLYQAYARWSDQNLVDRAHRMSAKLFGTKVGERFASIKTNTGKRYVGIGVRDTRQDTAPRLGDL